MRTLTGYFSRVLAGRVIAVLLVFVALLELMDLVDNIGDVLERRGSLTAVFVFTGLRLPTIVESAMPLSVLIGSIAAFTALANRNELVAIRAAGLPPARLLAAFLPVSLLLVILHFVLAFSIVPASERAFTRWWEPHLHQQDDAIWLSGADSIVRIGSMSPDAGRLRDVAIYLRDEAGNLEADLRAEEAVHGPAGWTLRNAREIQTAAATPEERRQASLAWPSGPEPESIISAVERPERLSTGTLTGMLTAAWSAGSEPAVYRTELARRYSGPVASLIMVLLAAPAISGQRRTGGPVAGAALGLALGLLFLVVGGLMAALGRAEVISPALAAWAPPVIFASFGVALLLHLEE